MLSIPSARGSGLMNGDTGKLEPCKSIQPFHPAPSGECGSSSITTPSPHHSVDSLMDGLCFPFLINGGTSCSSATVHFEFLIFPGRCSSMCFWGQCTAALELPAVQVWGVRSARKTFFSRPGRFFFVQLPTWNWCGKWMMGSLKVLSGTRKTLFACFWRMFSSI